MKQLLKNAFGLILLAGVFFSSVGVTIFSHTCLESNSSKISFFAEKSCCCDDAEAGISGDCCESRFSYLKVHSEKIVSGKVQVPQFDQVFPVIRIPVFQPCADISAPGFFRESPPPRTGRQILSLVQISRS